MALNTHDRDVICSPKCLALRHALRQNPSPATSGARFPKTTERLCLNTLPISTRTLPSKLSSGVEVASKLVSDLRVKRLPDYAQIRNNVLLEAFTIICFRSSSNLC
jgi:hypothetical protein